ncbi:hypothetical protein [Undibacterium sp. TJN19]|uniref:hypothetical protein n=1 Tax=Undibacterium sp. TJN19 TaxID=3413055 RepID=UPI003BF0F53C
MKKLIYCLLLLLCSTAIADENKTRYIITSFINAEKIHDLETQLKAHPSLREIEFVRSYGIYKNEIELTKKMLDLIDQYHLHTFARENCAFACATIFLYGYQRSLLPSADGKSSRLILRPLVSRDEEFLKEQTEEFFNKIVARSEGKIPADFLPLLYRVKDNFGAIHIFNKPDKDQHAIFLQDTGGGKYEAISELKAEDLGILVPH